MKAKYKPCKIVSNRTTGDRFIYVIKEGKSMPESHEGLIALPKTFVMTLYVEPILKQLRELGFKVKGERYLSQLTGEMTTDLFIVI